MPSPSKKELEIEKEYLQKRLEILKNGFTDRATIEKQGYLSRRDISQKNIEKAQKEINAIMTKINAKNEKDKKPLISVEKELIHALRFKLGEKSIVTKGYIKIKKCEEEIKDINNAIGEMDAGWMKAFDNNTQTKNDRVRIEKIDQEIIKLEQAENAKAQAENAKAQAENAKAQAENAPKKSQKTRRAEDHLQTSSKRSRKPEAFRPEALGFSKQIAKPTGDEVSKKVEGYEARRLKIEAEAQVYMPSNRDKTRKR